MKRLFFVLILVVAPCLTYAQDAHDLFQKALRLELASGDLPGAIALYERVVSVSTDRSLAAKALIQIGKSYEKLGLTEAVAAYQRVLDDYTDQPELATEARMRLAILQPESGSEAADDAAGSGLIVKQVYADPLAQSDVFSPTADGSGLVLNDWGERPNLAIRNLETDEIRSLTIDGSYDPLQYAWGATVSPDGKTVAYLWAEANTSSLRLVDIDGSNTRVLHRVDGCPVWTQPAWTRDSKGIVAFRGGMDCSGESGEVVLFSIDESPARTLMDSKQLDAASLSLGDRVSVSPDNRFAIVEATTEQNSNNQDIWIIDIQRGGATPLVRHPAGDRLIGWVPGTEYVLFVSDRDGRWDLWAVQVIDGAAEGLPTRLRRNIGEAGRGGWEPLGFTEDGSLFYSIFTRWSSLGVTSLDPGTGTPDDASHTSIPGSNNQAVWSPDGEQLAYVTEQEREGDPDLGPYRRPLHIRHLSTGTEKELAPNLQTRSPSWSPDGRFILTNGKDETNESAGYVGGLYRIDVQSGEASPVLELQAETETSWWWGISGVWAADGKAIIYSQYDGNKMMGSLVWRDLESGAERLLFQDPLLTTRLLALSPDGRRLVFAVQDTRVGSGTTISEGGRLKILETETGEIRELYHIEEPGRVSSLQWTPDGDYVLFSRMETEDRRTGVWRVSKHGGDAERLWTFAEDLYSGTFALSPDGQRAAVQTYTQELEIWVMENIKEALSEQQ